VATGSGTVVLDASSDITQNSSINGHAVTLRAQGDIAMTASTTTTSVNGSVLYDAGGNLSVSTIHAAGGNVTLKAGDNGEITDTFGDNARNVTASGLNMIGHGAISSAVAADAATMTSLRQKAIETKADRIFVASASRTQGMMDVQIGQEAIGILRDNKGWSVQFVNEGLFVPSMNYIALDGISIPAYDNTARGWKFVRDIDYQLLNHLAEMSDTLHNPFEPLQANIQSMALGASQGMGSYTSSPVSRLSSAQEAESADPFMLDPLSIDEYSMMPSFGISQWDNGPNQKAEGEPLFEYWIEDIVF